MSSVHPCTHWSSFNYFVVPISWPTDQWSISHSSDQWWPAKLSTHPRPLTSFCPPLHPLKQLWCARILIYWSMVDQQSSVLTQDPWCLSVHPYTHWNSFDVPIFWSTRQWLTSKAQYSPKMPVSVQPCTHWNSFDVPKSWYTYWPMVTSKARYSPKTPDVFLSTPALTEAALMCLYLDLLANGWPAKLGTRPRPLSLSTPAPIETALMCLNLD